MRSREGYFYLMDKAASCILMGMTQYEGRY